MNLREEIERRFNEASLELSEFKGEMNSFRKEMYEFRDETNQKFDTVFFWLKKIEQELEIIKKALEQKADKKWVETRIKFLEQEIILIKAEMNMN